MLNRLAAGHSSKNPVFQRLASSRQLKEDWGGWTRDKVTAFVASFLGPTARQC